MSILTGLEIRNQMQEGRISINPFQTRLVNQTSVDFTLGSEVAVYEDFVSEVDEDRGDGSHLRPVWRTGVVLDTKKPAAVRRWTMNPELGWVIYPGIGYLMHTAEEIHSTSFNPVLDGKSSIGRVFVHVHVTAGYGEPGFNGQYTLEVLSHFPVRVYPGMRFGQIRFHTVEGEIEDYAHRGHYTGGNAQGAVASQIHATAFD